MYIFNYIATTALLFRVLPSVLHSVASDKDFTSPYYNKKLKYHGNLKAKDVPNFKYL